MGVNYITNTIEDTLDLDELDLFNLITAHRTALGLASVKLSASLTLVAGRKVIDILYNIGTYSVGAPGENRPHGWSDRPYDGRNPNTYNVIWDAPQFLGTAYPGHGFEIAVGYNNVDINSLNITPAVAMQAWLDSPGHRALIESTGVWSSAPWQAIGVGMRAGVAFVWFGREPDPAGLPVVVPDDDITITLAVSPASVMEDGATNLLYTFARTGPTSNALSVNYTVGGTALLVGTPGDPADYTGIATAGSTKTVTFAVGASTAVVTVDPAADQTAEGAETVELTLAAGVGYTIGTSRAVVGTIINVPPPPPTISVASAAVAQAEGNSGSLSTLSFTISRSGNPGALLAGSSARWAVSFAGGSTSADAADFRSGTTLSGTVRFEPRETSRTLSFQLRGDRLQEKDENFTLTLSAPTGGTLGAATALGTIRNDDFIGNANPNTLIGGEQADFLDGRAAADILTGKKGADTFAFRHGSTSTAFSDSPLSAPDEITDYAVGVDKIALLSSTGASRPRPTSFSRAADNSNATTLSQLTAAVFADANGKQARNQPLVANGAALVVATNPAIAGTYLVINNGTAGRSQSADLLIKLSGVSPGALPALGSLTPSTMFL
jgi:Ca2+-binding RTX toxin-like protein